jgi:hypothetical protein
MSHEQLPSKGVRLEARGCYHEFLSTMSMAERETTYPADNRRLRAEQIGNFVLQCLR